MLLFVAVSLLFVPSEAPVSAKLAEPCEKMECLPGYTVRDEKNLPWCWPTVYPYSDCLYCEIRCSTPPL